MLTWTHHTKIRKNNQSYTFDTRLRQTCVQQLEFYYHLRFSYDSSLQLMKTHDLANEEALYGHFHISQLDGLVRHSTQ